MEKREIKFRVYDNISKMIHVWGRIRERSNFYDFTLKEHYTLMQFTGSKDSKLKDIYEGDILKNNKSFKWIVKWNNKGFYYLESNTDGFNRTSDFQYSELRTFEIVGNIYENPELLKK